MKKILFILLLGACSFAANAQQQVKSWYIYENGGYAKLMEIPSDTASVPAGRRDKPHLAYKNNLLYYWNPQFQFWMQVQGSGGGGTDTTGGGGSPGIATKQYIHEFQGNASAAFTTSKAPVDNQHISVLVNGVYVPSRCWTRTVNTVQLSQGCLNYEIDAGDDVAIIYHSIQ